MAKERMVNTKFWDDSYIVTLDPIEKLMYLYFITNPLTNICGIYEIQLRRISFDTGIDKEMVLKILGRFEKDEKIRWRNGWCFVKNFIRHQKRNPKVEKGIQIALESVPAEVYDSLCIDYDSLAHSNPNSNSNSNINNTEQSSGSPEEEKILEPFILEEYLEKMKIDKNRHVRLIGYFISRKGLRPTTKEEIGEIIRRNLKIAKRISDTYTKGKISKAVDLCIEKHSDIDWGLETVYKKLTNNNL